AQGIGLSVAERILAGGGAVSLWDNDQAVLQTTLERLGNPEAVHGTAVDIGELSTVERATREVLQRLGRLDILVNNAAIVGPNNRTWEYPPQAFRDVVHIGLTGTFHCCHAVVPHM